MTFRGNWKLFIDGSSGLFERNYTNFILLAIFIIGIIALLTKIVFNVRDFKGWWNDVVTQKIYLHPVTLLCVTWILSYTIFLLFFEPQNLFYRLFYFPALVILIGMFFLPNEDLTHIRQWRLALFVGVFCLYNFLFYIQPNSQVREGTQISLALQANKLWSEKTTVFFDSSNTDDNLITNNRLVRYFNPLVVWKPIDAMTLSAFENEVIGIYNEDGAVWLDSSAIKRISSNPQMTQWLSDNSEQTEKPELSAPKYDMKFIKITPKRFEK